MTRSVASTSRIWQSPILLLVAIIIAAGFVAAQFGIEGVGKTCSMAVALVLIWRRQGYWIVTRQHDAVLFWVTMALLTAILISGLFEIVVSLQAVYALSPSAGKP